MLPCSTARSVEHLNDHLPVLPAVSKERSCTGGGPPACRSDRCAQGGGIVRLLDHFAGSVPKEHWVGEVRNTIELSTTLQLKEMLTEV